MNRRDLLLLRVRSGARVVELPCGRLYMRYLDTQRPERPATAVQEDYFLGEPEPDYPVPSVRELFDGLSEELKGADVLRISEAQWLADADFHRHVDELAARFRAAGGKVEVVVGDTSAAAPAGSAGSATPGAPEASASPAAPTTPAAVERVP